MNKNLLIGSLIPAPVADKKARGRPRSKPVVERRAPVLIEVRDQRPEVAPRVVGIHHNVPGDLTGREVLERFGIAEHLRVISRNSEGTVILQQGRS